MNRRQRRIALYFVLGALLINIIVPVARGTAPPGEIYAVIGTIAGYLLVGGSKKDDDNDGDSASGTPERRTRPEA